VRLDIGVPACVHGVEKQDELNLEDGVVVKHQRNDDEEPLAHHHDWPVVDRVRVPGQMNACVHVFVDSPYWVGIKPITVSLHHFYSPHWNAERKE
jgi:hypothetical protein